MITSLLKLLINKYWEGEGNPGNLPLKMTICEPKF